MGIAIFPGSFDPFTNGHLDVVRTALDLADKVVLAIGVHPTKSALFTLDERAEMIREVIAESSAETASRVGVISFDGLIVEAARAAGATILLRGIRDGTDLDYEMQMAGMNAVLAPELRTVFIPAPSAFRHVSATLVRQIAHMGGDIASFVPPNVASRMEGRR